LPVNGKAQQCYAVVAVQRQQWELLFLCGLFLRQQWELSFSLWSGPRLYNSCNCEMIWVLVKQNSVNSVQLWMASKCHSSISQLSLELRVQKRLSCELSLGMR
jgi:hypothetical protein